MGDHYFTNKPSASHDRRKWQATLLNQSFTFVTDSNVFSKDGVDFGSRTLLESFYQTDSPEGNLLDVGCGYGPIGLTLAKDTDQEVHMVDVNERALSLAKENAELNGISNVSIYESNMYDQVTESNFAAVVSNPPIRAGKKIVHGIIEGAYDKLMPNGTLTIVIQKKQGSPSARKKMEEVFGNVMVVTSRKGYQILVSRK